MVDRVCEMPIRDKARAFTYDADIRRAADVLLGALNTARFSQMAHWPCSLASCIETGMEEALPADTEGQWAALMVLRTASDVLARRIRRGRPGR